ncbi:MAG: patatin-like phospholipase family protein [Melioribacteraceae bacterium]|jgi:patatin-like phospholipase/acyl hydrolase|nr:patatin-like phospholipase family protein [Melioribacteraceae bacterium]
MDRKTFNILAIDGGGIRGVFPAHILQCIEERLNVNLLETFDMIAGTSTGSIIAAGVAIGIPATNIVEMYKQHGERIFTRKKFFLPWKKLKSMLQPMIESIYNSQNLYNLLSEVFEEKLLGEIKKPLLLPSTDIGNGLVHVLKSGYNKEFNRDNKVPIKDAVLASCSAPTYFDPHKVKEYLLADGGLWANNPSLVAVIEAKKRFDVNLSDIKILSVGTGHSQTMYGTSLARRWGLINGWRHKMFINFIMSLQGQSSLNYLSLILRHEQIKRIDFPSDNPLPLDDITKVDDLISRADKEFTHRSKEINDFLIDNKGV